MSTRDEQPATVPPPAGEDDAYSATTKVGAMPADIMEKLRAEGLLPEDVEQEERAKAEAAAAMRPSTSLEKRSPPRPGLKEATAPPPASDAPVPQLYSMPPAPPATEDAPPSKMETAKPPAMPEIEGLEGLAGIMDGLPLPPPPPPDAIETPVAFAFPPASQVPTHADLGTLSEEQKDTTALTPQKAAQRAKAPSKAVMAVVGVLVVLLLIVALLRLRG